VEEAAEGERGAVRIVFWGTPEFARTVLEGLLEAGREVVGVVTQPDKPAGRGRKPQAPPVKAVAEEAGLPVLQPERPRGAEFMRELERLAPDVSVVAAYGRILRPEVLELPPLGAYNVHASLLPKLRGAAPVNWAIIRGDRETGVTIMKMVAALDAGPIVLQVPCEIPADATAGSLAERLAELGARAMVEALALIEAGRAEERPQAEAEATYAPKLSPEDARIEWARPAEEIERWIRGTDPTPGMWTLLGDLRVRVFRPRVLEGEAGAEPGTVVRADPREGLEVATGSGRLAIGEVQPAGKRRMEAAEWIRGRGVSAGARFD
jgi:methionyl-tRNA formyltransferase